MKTLILGLLKRSFPLFLLIYVFILHVIIISVIINPNLAYRVAIELKLEPDNELITHYMSSMNTMHARVDQNTPSNTFIFIGDSLIQGLSVSSISSAAVNFGIGHDTINGVKKRSLKYKSLQNASSILISVGVNDLRYNSVKRVISDYKKMLHTLNNIHHVFIHEVLPIDSNKLGRDLQKKINLFNNDLFKLTNEFDNITLLKSSSKFLDLNDNLNPSLHLGDGLHLNKKGYDIWIQQLRQQLDAK